MRLSNWRIFNLFLILFLLLVECTSAQTISDIRFIGLKRTKYSYLRDFVIHSKVGEKIDSLKIKKDVQEIYNLRHFESVRFSLMNIDSQNVELHFIINETLSMFPMADVGFTKDFIRYQVGFIDFNTFGRSGNTTIYIRQLGAISYGINGDYPFLLGKRHGMSVDLLRQGSLEPIWNNEVKNEYKYDLYTASLLWRYDFNLRSYLRVGGGFQHERLEPHFIENLDNSYPKVAKHNRWMYRLNYRYTYINLKRVTQRGVYFDLNFQGVSPSVQKNVLYGNSWRLQSDLRVYTAVFKGSNVAARIRLGLGESALLDQFVLDDNTNIRGIGFKRYRSNYEFVLNVENRQTIYTHPLGIVQAVIFNDFSVGHNYSGLGIRVYAEPLHGIVFRIDYGIGTPAFKDGGMIAGIHQYF